MVSCVEYARIDDFLCSWFIDGVYYWGKTRKFGPDFRDVSKGSVSSLLKKHICLSEQCDHRQALGKFMSRLNIRQFLATLPDDTKLLAEFERHASRYIQMYNPQCAFSIDVTDRYSMLKPGAAAESCVIARKHISAGSEIKYLTAILVPFSELEKEALGHECGPVRDFSVVNSSRLAKTCLLLGPARFVNHSCDANAKFLPISSRMTIVAIKDIPIGQQITVEYSKNYFGLENSECLCLECSPLEENAAMEQLKFRLPDDSPAYMKYQMQFYLEPFVTKLPTSLCDNCGLPFIKSTCPPKCIHCPRCHRHAQLYNALWPSMDVEDELVESRSPSPAIVSSKITKSASGRRVSKWVLARQKQDRMERAAAKTVPEPTRRSTRIRQRQENSTAEQPETSVLAEKQHIPQQETTVKEDITIDPAMNLPAPIISNTIPPLSVSTSASASVASTALTSPVSDSFDLQSGICAAGAQKAFTAAPDLYDLIPGP